MGPYFGANQKIRHRIRFLFSDIVVCLFTLVAKVFDRVLVSKYGE